MEDGDPKHQSALTANLKTTGNKFHRRLATNSLNLNQIENIWSYVED